MLFLFFKIVSTDVIIVTDNSVSLDLSHTFPRCNFTEIELV